ncbi:PQQ-binding-like beta-propeller repeat protein [Kitasatospora sp. NPDC097643]|uniref:protein kinase domain-containing protein n=1 Tax=Kitasatospora sp. NPDC097643 TaxID=3157230 RepID=UPI0033216BCC
MLQPLPPDGRRLIGPYLTLARLGAGGMGEVYLARSPGAGSPEAGSPGAGSPEAGSPGAGSPEAAGGGPGSLVAVKTLLPEPIPDDEHRARFQREIDSARAVSAALPGTLLACDPSAEPPWLASEFIPGPTLAEAVEATGPLDERTVRALGVGLAAELGAVHAQGLLHRDLKPGNVLLSSTGPRLIDFGIAKRLNGTVFTAVDKTVGTPGYMSPEHLDSETPIGPASDVFCLAAVLAYASCGRGPFGSGHALAVLGRISRAEADLSLVPTGLRGVLAECLRLRPQDRPDLAELTALLGAEPAPPGWPRAVAEMCTRYEQDAAYLAALPLPLPLVPAAPQAPSRRRRGRLVGAAVLGVVLSVLGALLVPRWLADTSVDASPPPTNPTVTRGSSGPAPTPGPLPVAMAAGDAGASGEFGSAALNTASIRTSWAPWHKELGIRLGGCALGEGLYLCSRADGGLIALDADNGTTRWSLDPKAPLKGRLGDATVRAPVLVDGNAYTTDGSYTRAIRLRDHVVRWEKPAPSGRIALGVVLVGKTLVTDLADPDSPRLGGSGAADRSELRAYAADDGRELWTTPLNSAATAPIALDGRLYAMSDRRLVMLETTGGTVTGSTAAACTALHGYGQWVVCADTGEGKVSAFDARHLDGGRTLLTGAGSHLALGAKGLLVADGMTAGAHSAVDLATGRPVWSHQFPEDQRSKTTALLLADDKAVELTLASPGIIDLTQGANAVPRPVSFPDWPGSRDDGGVSAGEPSAVLSGGLLYAGFADGTVLSGYAPQ